MSSFTLKILALISMTIDHIGFLIFPDILIYRFIGRLAFPIFAFQLGVGFAHSKNKEKHIIRMLIFTLISQIPFLIFNTAAQHGHVHAFTLNIGATLTCGLLILYCIEKFNKTWLKFLFTILITLLGVFIPMDYGWYGILTIVILYFSNKSKILSFFTYIIFLCLYCNITQSEFYIPAVLALIPLAFYNGKKGPSAKYLFYVFYPLHMLILVFIKTLI